MSKLPSVKDLYVSAIEVQPRNVDWSKGYGDTWECIEATKCEKCGAVLVSQGGDKHSNIDDTGEVECDGWVSEVSGPMMNFFYSLEENVRRFDLDEAAKKIVDLPLCLVVLDGDEVGLALTGGGMDLSWQICEAYMLLGFLPPAHFATLPQMCGRGTSSRDRWIAAGCARTFEVCADWAESRLRRLRETLKWARKYEREQKAARS